MSRNQKRLTATASKQAAIQDLAFVYNQRMELGYKLPMTWRENHSARKIHRATREMIKWAKANDIEITLPEGWEP
jgi:hypothetical protein